MQKMQKIKAKSRQNQSKSRQIKANQGKSSQVKSSQGEEQRECRAKRGKIMQYRDSTRIKAKHGNQNSMMAGKNQGESGQIKEQEYRAGPNHGNSNPSGETRQNIAEPQ